MNQDGYCGANTRFIDYNSNPRSELAVLHFTILHSLVALEDQGNVSHRGRGMGGCKAASSDSLRSRVPDTRRLHSKE